MARHRFGGGAADWAFTYNSDGSVAQASGAVLTFWNALSGGTQYTAAPRPGGIDDGTGLLDGTGLPIMSVTCDSNGEIPDSLQGPDGVYRMAADASGAGTGPRRWVYANDFGSDLTTLITDVASIPALQAAPEYVYYNTATASYPARPATAAPVWWVGPVAPPVGGTGATGSDVWLNTTGGTAPAGVASVTAADASVVVSGTASAPAVATGTLDGIAALHPPVAAWSNNGFGITGGAPGVAGTDFATVSQIAAGLAPTPVKTGAYTAAASDFVRVSTVSGAVTITLPSGAADQARAGVKMVAQTGANAVTVATSGADRFNVAGGVATLTLTRLFQTVTVQYDAADGLWLITGADLALSIDTTAADIKPTSTAAGAGSSSKIPAADHVHAQDYAGTFGDGSDGAVTLDGTVAPAWASKVGSVYTLTRDVFCTNLTINSGVTLTPAGYRIFCQGTFTNNGTVSANGNPGNNGGAVAPSTGSGTLGGGRSSGAGTATTGNPGLPGTFSSTGGTGGTGTAGNLGGAGGTPVTASAAPLRSGPSYVMAGVFPFNGTNNVLQGGSAGGGGGGDGTNKGASGGSGGGIIAILAWAIVNNGTFTATGGNGVAPSGTATCGGGAGGGGGLVLGYSLTPWTAGTITVTGGTGGNGTGAGTAGTAGTAGASLNVVLA